MSKKILVPLFVIVLVLVAVTGVVSAGSAVVYNHVDDTDCGFLLNGGFYVGSATMVLVDGPTEGKINVSCHASLVSGNAMPTIKKYNPVPFGVNGGFITCKIVVTPAGNAKVSCPNQYAQPVPSW